MATAYNLIASNKLSSSATSITFGSVPNIYTDLIVKWSAQGTGGSIYLRLNSNTSNSYSYTALRGNGNSLDSFRESSVSYIFLGSQPTSTNWSNGELYIPNYTSNTNKTMYSIVAAEGNAAYISNQMMSNSSIYLNSSAITEIQLTLLGGGSFLSGSSFFLYGIKKS